MLKKPIAQYIEERDNESSMKKLKLKKPIAQYIEERDKDILYGESNYPKLLEGLSPNQYIILDIIHSILVGKSLDEGIVKTTDIRKELDKKGVKLSEKIQKKKLERILTTLVKLNIIRKQSETSRNKWVIKGEVLDALGDLNKIQENLKSNLDKSLIRIHKIINTNIDSNNFFDIKETLRYVMEEMQDLKFKIYEIDKKFLQYHYEILNNFAVVEITFAPIIDSQILESNNIKEGLQVDFKIIVKNSHYNNLRWFNCQDSKGRDKLLINHIACLSNLKKTEIMRKWMQNILDYILLLILETLDSYYPDFKIILSTSINEKQEVNNIIDFISTTNSK